MRALPLALLLACAAAHAEDAHMANESMYPTAFASPRRDSFIPVTTAAKGTVGATHDLGMTHVGGRLDLLFLGRDTVVVQAAGFALFTPDGKRQWEQATWPGSPVAVGADRVYFETEGQGLEAVDASGQKLFKEGPLPGVANRGQELLLLWPRASDFVSAIDYGDPKYNLSDLNAKIKDPRTTAARTTYGSRTTAWSKAFIGVTVLRPLYVPEKDRWLTAQDKVISVDMASNDENLRVDYFPLPMAKPVMWSADAEGMLVVAGLDQKDRKDIVTSDLVGRERWHWVDREEEDGWNTAQPPIRAPKGRVYLFTTRRVLAFEAGKMVWQYEPVQIRDKEKIAEPPGYGTALADGSLLLAAGATLRKLDAGGKVVFAVTLPAEIMSPPVVDAQGTIYVATAGQLVQIK